MVKRFQRDVEERRWDELRSRAIIREIDLEPHFEEYDEYLILNEDARVDYESARSSIRNIISHVILLSIYRYTPPRDRRANKVIIENPRDHWYGEIKEFIKDFRQAISITDFNELGNTNAKNRITDNLNKIYDDSMNKVLKEVADSIEKGEDQKFFDGEIPTVIRVGLPRFFSKTRSRSNLIIPDHVINAFKEYFEIPETSPWIIDNFLAVKLPEEFPNYERARNADVVAKRIRGRYKRTLSRNNAVQDNLTQVSNFEEMNAEKYFRDSVKENLLDKLTKRD